MSSLRSLRGLLTVLLVLPLFSCGFFESREEAPGPAELTGFEPQAHFVEVWRSKVGNGQGKLYNRLSPAVVNNRLYVAAADGTVEAFRLSNGKSQWTADLSNKTGFSLRKDGRQVTGGVGVGDDLVLLGSATGEVIALDRRSGEQRWITQLDGEVLAPPVARDGVVIVQTLSEEVIALSSSDGHLLWSYNATIPLLTLRGTSTPLIYRDQVIIGFANGKLIAFDLFSGEIVWDLRVALATGQSEIERLVDIDAPLLLTSGPAGDMLFVVSYQGQLAAVNPATGHRLWSQEASSSVNLAQGLEHIYVSAQEGSVLAFVQNGQGIDWEQDALARRGLTGPATLGQWVIVGDIEGYLHALSQIDGDFAARTLFDSQGIQSVLLVEQVGDEEQLIVYGNSGYLGVYQLLD